MSDIADRVLKKYAPDEDDSEGADYDEAETPDERATECARDAIRAVKANDAEAFRIAIRELISEDG